MSQPTTGTPRLTMIDEPPAGQPSTTRIRPAETMGPPAGEAPRPAPSSAVPGGPAGASGQPIRTRVVIVGSGPAGLTAAIYAARAALEPIVIGGYAPGGQLMITSDVENYPGFEESIEGPELMARFRKQAERFGARIVDVDVERVDLAHRPFGLWAGGQEYRAEAIIVATGASALWLGLDNETRLRGKGVSACATCDGFFFRGKKVVVVGGGDTAMEEALFLTRFATEVVVVHRRDKLRCSRIMEDRARGHDRIRILWNKEIADVLGESAVSGVLLRDTETGEESVEPTDGLFVAIGYRPNTEAFRGWLGADELGYLEVQGDTGSAIEGVFIAGDVHDHRYRQAVTAAGEGCKAAIDVERWLEANETLEPEAAVSPAAVSPAAVSGPA
ncbi:MAG TPA: thioredoxin-disulfide reductase [Candidatus Limnocylindrales bacterium]|nr:thioredoxin-disulfide reductase [Candidatus Limnocylindrales bacterium]